MNARTSIWPLQQNHEIYLTLLSLIIEKKKEQINKYLVGDNPVHSWRAEEDPLD